VRSDASGVKVLRRRAGGYDEAVGLAVYDTLRYCDALAPLVVEDVRVLLGSAPRSSFGSAPESASSGRILRLAWTNMRPTTSRCPARLTARYGPEWPSPAIVEEEVPRTGKVGDEHDPGGARYNRLVRRGETTGSRLDAHRRATVPALLTLVQTLDGASLRDAGATCGVG
jgi:hypothetical protein